MKSCWIAQMRVWTLAGCLLASTTCAQPVREPSRASLEAIRALPHKQRIAALLELEAASPDSARVQVELGLAYGTTERFVAAERHFQAAYHRAGRDRQLRRQATLGLANAHLGQGEPQKALDAATEGGPEPLERSFALLRARAYFLLPFDSISAKKGR